MRKQINWGQSLASQALVEMAIILPLLLIMLLGVLEVGYAIREYQIVLNASREGARYASRAGVMNLTSQETAQKSYDKIIEHTRLNVRGEYNNIIISNLEIIPTGTCTGTYTIKSSDVISYYQSAPSFVNLKEITQTLITEETVINCEKEKKGFPLYDNKMVMVEIHHKHYQLTKFFPRVDPQEWHVYTVMRILPQRDIRKD